MQEALAFLEKLGSVGFPTLLLLILYGSYKNIWVWGRLLEAKQIECEQWKTIAIRTLNNTEKAIDIAASKTGG